MKQYNNGPRKGMMYGGATRRKPMMYGGTATKPPKKAQMGGMMSAPEPLFKPAMGMPKPDRAMMGMAKGGLAGGIKATKKKEKTDRQLLAESDPTRKTPFGMLSVKAGMDKNPNPTQADRIAGAKMRKKRG